MRPGGLRVDNVSHLSAHAEVKIASMGEWDRSVFFYVSAGWTEEGRPCTCHVGKGQSARLREPARSARRGSSVTGVGHLDRGRPASTSSCPSTSAVASVPVRPSRQAPQCSRSLKRWHGPTLLVVATMIASSSW